MSVRLVYTPCKNKHEAKKLAKSLLEKGLIACANFFPVQSMYVWKGKPVEESEMVLLCKTSASKAQKAAKLIEKLHSYECPAVLVLSAHANVAFEKWVQSSK